MITRRDQLGEPVAITLDTGTEKLNGFIMKLTTTGLLVELDKIPFKVGSYVTASFQLIEEAPIIERMRSIKHYDHFFRRPPKKRPPPDQPAPVPKKLAELHFYLLKEANRVAITKYVLALKNAALSARRKTTKNIG